MLVSARLITFSHPFFQFASLPLGFRGGFGLWDEFDERFPGAVFRKRKNLLGSKILGQKSCRVKNRCKDDTMNPMNQLNQKLGFCCPCSANKGGWWIFFRCLTVVTCALVWPRQVQTTSPCPGTLKESGWMWVGCWQLLVLGFVENREKGRLIPPKMDWFSRMERY